MTATLETGWSQNPDPQPGETEPPRQNSRIPRFSDGNDDTGGGAIFYEDDATSPCTGAPNWIGCNPNTPGSKGGYEIHVRQLPSPSAPTWMWFQRDATCADVRDDSYATSVCFSVRRVVVHEAIHNALTRLHDTQGGSLVAGHGDAPGHADEEREPRLLEHRHLPSVRPRRRAARVRRP